MRLAAWVAINGYGSITRLSKATGKRYATIHALVRGASRAKYDTARLIEKATDGQVTVAELCAPDDLPPGPSPEDGIGAPDGIEETRDARE